MLNHTSYVMDRHAIVRRVGGAWNSFAKDNGGFDALDQHVLGHSIWAAFSGDAIRSYMNAIFFACRKSGAQVVLPYRCDSQVMRRQVRMIVTPITDSGLHVAHSIIATTEKQTARQIPSRCDTCDVCCETLPLAETLHVSLTRATGAVCKACRTRANRHLDTLLLRDKCRAVQMPPDLFAASMRRAANGG